MPPISTGSLTREAVSEGSPSRSTSVISMRAYMGRPLPVRGFGGLARESFPFSPPVVRAMPRERPLHKDTTEKRTGGGKPPSTSDLVTTVLVAGVMVWLWRFLG